MAHFALIDENNIVQEVHVLNNDIITDKDGNEQEYLGVNFLTNLHKSTGTWKQTSSILEKASIIMLKMEANMKINQKLLEEIMHK